MDDLTRVWLALGSNLGASDTLLQEAWQELGTFDPIGLITLSCPYVSTPVGMESDYLFLNAVGVLDTELGALALLELLQQVERGAGRLHKTGVAGYQDRLLDLDVLYFGEQVLDSGTLLLPHPRLAERRFVLEPLAEIDPGHRDPVSQLTAEVMRRDLLQKMEAGTVPYQEIRRECWA